MALTGEVQVPGLGKIPKKEGAIGLVVVGTLIVVYFVRKNSSSSSTTPAAAAPTSANQYPPDGTTGNPSDPYSTDPATGQTYGDEAAGSGGLYGAFGSGSGYGFGGTGYDPVTGLFTDPNGNTCPTPDASGYCPNTSGSGGTQGPPFSSNSDWSNWVISQMESTNPNLDVGALTDALGLYLQGQPVDAAQKTLIFDAEAVGGPPPVAGPNNFPPNVQTNGSKGPGPGPTVTMPPIIGESVSTAESDLKAAGLGSKITSKKKTGKVLRCFPQPGAQVAKGYVCQLTVG